jgi:hypothetical protein
MNPDVPAPESVPPVNNTDPQRGYPKPKAPPSEDDSGRPVVPVELPGQPHAPERVAGEARRLAGGARLAANLPLRAQLAQQGLPGTPQQ